jgi:MFS family permease
MVTGMSANQQKFKIFLGWYVVAGAFLIMALSHGGRYCFGIFVQPLTDENGWSRSVVSLAASINLLVYALGGIGSGKLLDRIAPRWIATIGAAVGAAGFLLCSGAKTPLEFYFAYGLLCGFGSSWTGSVTMNTSVGKWFTRKRGLAIGISSMGISFGTITLTAATAYIVEHFSWKTGFLFIGLSLLIPGILIAQLLLRRTVPEAYGLTPDGDLPAAEGNRGLPAGSAAGPPPTSTGSIRGDSRFWILALCHGTAVMAALLAYVHQVPYAIDNGIEKIAAAASLSAMGFAGLLGQFLFGWISDRIGDPKYSAALGYLFMAAGMAILLQTRSVEMLFLYSVVFGFGVGSLGPLLPILTADRFGRQNMGSNFGFLNFFVVGLGGFLGPLVGGLVYDGTGSYRYAWGLNLVLLVIMAAIIATLKRNHCSYPSAVATRRPPSGQVPGDFAGE